MLIALLAVLTAIPASASEIMVASGAGFKKMVVDIAKTCESNYDLKMEMSFGNLGQVLAQVKTTGLIEAVIGDERFFKKAGLDFASTALIGNGKLVFAWRKGLQIDSLEDITSDKVARIAIPDIKKAIYGRAGTEFLTSRGITDKVKDKLYIVSTVPQVTSYLVTGEVDGGFSNLTDIQAAADKIGGYIVIEDGYAKINIITGVLKGFENKDKTDLYLKCITSDEVKAVAKKHGL